MKPRRVVIRKRDGTLECFSLAKLRGGLAHVMRARACDPHLADPLARAIAAHVGQWDEDDLPSTEYIFACVCTALTQTGLGEVAEELSAQRRLRQSRRRRLRVSDPLEPERSAARWRKGALVATLQNVYDLRQSVARFLAGRIEERVFGLRYRLLSKPLLAEMVREEVLAWGLLEVPGAGPREIQAGQGRSATPPPYQEN